MDTSRVQFPVISFKGPYFKLIRQLVSITTHALSAFLNELYSHIYDIARNTPIF